MKWRTIMWAYGWHTYRMRLQQSTNIPGPKTSIESG